MERLMQRRGMDLRCSSALVFSLRELELDAIDAIDAVNEEDEDEDKRDLCFDQKESRNARSCS